MALLNDNQILLSICIPTFNRARSLDLTLDSITKQSIFRDSNKIEIIVSDNCSTDETQFIVNNYQEKFPNKIIYSKNDFDYDDKNFEKVLSLGSGLFLKLNNDTLVHNSNSLFHILELINENIDNKSILFFTTGILLKESVIKGDGLSEFINLTSHFCTWIACFGIWKSEFDKINNFNECSDMKLIQVDILFKLFNNTTNFVIDDRKLFSPIPASRKGGYDLVTIFLDNFGQLLNKQVGLKKITVRDYDIVMKRVIDDFLSFWLAKAYFDRNNYFFVMSNPIFRLNKYYNFNQFKLIHFYYNLLKQLSSDFLIKIKILINGRCNLH